MLNLLDKYHLFFENHQRQLQECVYFKVEGEGEGHKSLVLPTTIVSCFAILRERIIRHWPLDHVEFSEHMIGGKKNPFDLSKLAIKHKAFINVCQLISEKHYEVESLRVEDVLECDRVVEQLNLDKYRPWYFSRSRQNDETYSYYDMEVVEPSRTSLDINDISNAPDFRKKAVIDPGNFHGAICRVFEYTLPDDVLAVQSFHIYFEHWGGNIALHHLSPTHHSFAVISSEDNNNWWKESYEEKFDDDDLLKKVYNGVVGYQDIIANAKGGDSIQLWLESNGYDSSRYIKMKFRFIRKIG